MLDKRNYGSSNSWRVSLPRLDLTFLKDTHREKAPSNISPALRKSTNMGVWAVGTLNQLFISGS